MKKLFYSACNFKVKKSGAFKKGRGTFGTFQSIMLTFMHVLCSAIVYIPLWYVPVSRSVQVHANTAVNKR